MMKWTSKRTCIRAVGIGVAVWAWTFSAMAAYVVLPNGNRIEGDRIRARSDGTVTLETSAGSRTFTKGQYREAVADKPAAIDEASRLVQQEQYDAAIEKLEGVVRQYRFLGWDVTALKVLPQIYMRKGAYTEAVDAYEKLFRTSPASQQDSEVLFGYFESLMQAKQYDKLEPKLDKVIAEASRADAARAQILRGDIKAEKELLEEAVLDYLRTAILFEAQAEVQPEALFKAARTLERLRDDRADEFYRRVLEQYPSSRYASEAKARL